MTSPNSSSPSSEDDLEPSNDERDDNIDIDEAIAATVQGLEDEPGQSRSEIRPRTVLENPTLNEQPSRRR